MKCHLCGKSIRNSSRSKVTICKDCHMKLETKNGKEVLCPNDKTRMEKKYIWNVVIDQCPLCGGIWLEHGELAIIKKSIADGYQDKYIEGLAIGLSVHK